MDLSTYGKVIFKNYYQIIIWWPILTIPPALEQTLLFFVSITLLKIFPRSFSAFFSLIFVFYYTFYLFLFFTGSVFSTIKFSIASRVKDYTPCSSKWLIWHFGKRMGKVFGGTGSPFLRFIVYVSCVLALWAPWLLRGLLRRWCVFSWDTARLQAQRLHRKSWRVGLAVPPRVRSPQNRGWNQVPCIGRQILNHWMTREAQEASLVPFM